MLSYFVVCLDGIPLLKIDYFTINGWSIGHYSYDSVINVDLKHLNSRTDKGWIDFETKGKINADLLFHSLT
jgi:hypothetical protein